MSLLSEAPVLVYLRGMGMGFDVGHARARFIWR
jgi:hypothetical protein